MPRAAGNDRLTAVPPESPPPEPPPDPTPPPEPPPEDENSLSDLVDRLASFDPSELERKIAAVTQIDLSQVGDRITELLAPLDAKVDALVKEIRKLSRTGAPSVPPAAAPGAGPPGGGAPPEPPPSPPRGRFDVGAVIGDIPHVGP